MLLDAFSVLDALRVKPLKADRYWLGGFLFRKTHIMRQAPGFWG